MRGKISKKKITELVEERKLDEALNRFHPNRDEKVQQDYIYLGKGNASVTAGHLKSKLEKLESNYSSGHIDKIKFDEEFEQIGRQIIQLADKQESSN